MFAVVEIGGRQYRVEEKDKLEVELLDKKEGDEIVFDKVLLTVDKETQIGHPYLAGVQVTAKVLQHTKGDKIIVYKFRPKTRYRKTQGHRQNHTILEIQKIG